MLVSWMQERHGNVFTKLNNADCELRAKEFSLTQVMLVKRKSADPLIVSNQVKKTFGSTKSL